MEEEKLNQEAMPETAAEQPVETTMEAPAEEPAESPAETAAETPAEAPAEPAAEIPAETPAEPAAEAPAETTAETPAEPAAEAPAEPRKPGLLRDCRSWTDIIPIAVILSVGLMVLGELATGILYGVTPVRDWFASIAPDEGSALFLAQYFDFIGIWIAFIVIITIFRPNWPMWKAFFYNGHGNNLRAIPIGILLGGGMNGFCILMSVLSGDIRLRFNEFNPTLLFAFLLSVIIQSGAEEIADRCYLYQKLRRRYRWPAVAILVNSVVFSALHYFNPDVTWLGLLQVFEIGVLFSLIIYFYDSLWTVIWAHTAWNFSQSIVFGLPNSGIVSAYSVFKLDAASARNGFFYNTGFGVEGSVGANVIIGVMILIVLISGLVRRRGERADIWQKMEAAGRVRTTGQKVLHVLGWILMVAFAVGLGYLYRNYGVSPY